MNQTIEDQLKGIVQSVAEDFMLRPELIIGQARYYPYPEARRVVATKLRDLGYSYPEIGKAMDRDRTSIMYMVDKDFRKRKMISNKLSAARQLARAS